jgi:hypothetical protein
MTRADVPKAMAKFFQSWKTTVTAATLVLVLVGADGRKTAAKLETHITQDVPKLIDQQRLRDSVDAAEVKVMRRQLNALLDRMDASNLSDCLIQRNAVVRRELECGRLESEAGISR